MNEFKVGDKVKATNFKTRCECRDCIIYQTQVRKKPFYIISKTSDFEEGFFYCTPCDSVDYCYFKKDDLVKFVSDIDIKCRKLNV